MRTMTLAVGVAVALLAGCVTLTPYEERLMVGTPGWRHFSIDGTRYRGTSWDEVPAEAGRELLRYDPRPAGWLEVVKRGETATVYAGYGSDRRPLGTVELEKEFVVAVAGRESGGALLVLSGKGRARIRVLAVSNGGSEVVLVHDFPGGRVDRDLTIADDGAVCALWQDEEGGYHVFHLDPGAEPVEVADAPSGRRACAAITPDGRLLVTAAGGVFRGLRREPGGPWREAWSFRAEQPIRLRPDPAGAVVAASYGRSVIHAIFTNHGFCTAFYRVPSGRRLSRFDTDAELEAVWPAGDEPREVDEW